MENIKQFETYYFDGVYYTKEEILAMGLEIRSYDSMRVFLENKSENCKISKIINENNISELSKADILENSKINIKTVEYVVKQVGCSLSIFDFTKYYGIDYDGVIYLASSSSEREEKILDLHNLVKNRVCSYRSNTFFTNESRYEAQQKILNKNKHLKHLIKAIPGN